MLEGCADVVDEHVSVEANLRIARGLDYYTGTVFETLMTGYEWLKSICSGDGTTHSPATAATYPGVGISLGVSRMLIPLLSDGVLAGSRPVPSAVLVALPDEAPAAGATRVAGRLRARGIAGRGRAAPQKFGRQIRHAERRGIPFVWFPGSDGRPDEVKDIRSGEQVPADPDLWTPPEKDLRPQVVVTES